MNFTPMPDRIKKLKIDNRGFPIPFFVGYKNGKPDHRLIDGKKIVRCHLEKLCNVCGQKLGAYKTFVLFPMCTVNRATSEPPCHHECALWSVKNCPHMRNPFAKRNEVNKSLEAVGAGGGLPIENEGMPVQVLWTTKKYRIHEDLNGLLFYAGDPTEVTWWSGGEPANRHTAEQSINSRIHILQDGAKKEPGALEFLNIEIEKAKQYLPA